MVRALPQTTEEDDMPESSRTEMLKVHAYNYTYKISIQSYNIHNDVNYNYYAG